MITIDTREPQEFQSKGDRVELMQYGDARIEIAPKKGAKSRRVLTIERKTPQDLISSVESGRLNNQLAGCDMLILQDVYDTDFLPRGVWDRLYQDGILRMIVNGINRHTPVQYAYDVDDYFRLLRILERELRFGEYGVLTVRRTVDKRLANPLIGPIAQVPGIGHELASRIIEKWPSPYLAINHVSEWDQVEGISLKKRNAAMRFLMGVDPDGLDERG